MRGFARSDAIIGPVFATRIVDWKPYLQRVCSVIFGKGERLRTDVDREDVPSA